jgi:hypothetical protein
MSRFTDRNLLSVLDLDGQDFLNPLLPALIGSFNQEISNRRLPPLIEKEPRR